MDGFFIYRNPHENHRPGRALLHSRNQRPPGRPCRPSCKILLPPIFGTGKIADGLLDMSADPLGARLKNMDDNGIDVQVLSLTTPGVQSFDPAQSVDFARRCNDLAAELIAKRPRPFPRLRRASYPRPRSRRERAGALRQRTRLQRRDALRTHPRQKRRRSISVRHLRSRRISQSAALHPPANPANACPRYLLQRLRR